ncbi:hypothetical protein HOK51_04385 [Candidatus Woesearchaeota archaeon]|jgi:NAD kinase|nr:hypothetical protein [Candidatus Woesearchaeota archaeon]MBT6519061.1 hypothetical protein [Candidatus Woesearchaeota archaeon]MBT7366875.1 hypothetical protein [Candidatus Woesearchaeota archaeon]
MLVRDMNIGKILVVYKKARYDILMEHQEDKLTKKYLQNEDNVRQLMQSRDDQNRMTEKVMNDLDAAGFQTTYLYRGGLNKDVVAQHDCVITTGGDGTVLEANSYSVDTPIMGINTDKRKVANADFDSSEGFYCAMSQQDYNSVFKKFLEGDLEVSNLMRLEGEINGKKVKNRNNGLVHRVMNEISLGGRTAHSSANYVVRIGEYEEYQASSGILIATPQQSWAYWEMGDFQTLLPIDGNAFHIVARGLGPKQCHPHKKTKEFIIDSAEYVEVISKNPRTSLGFDGDYPDTKHQFGLDSVLKVYRSEQRSKIIGFDKEKRLWYLKKENQPIVRRF